MNSYEKIKAQMKALQEEPKRCVGHSINLRIYEILLNGVNKNRLKSKLFDALLSYFVLRPQKINEKNITEPQIQGELSKTNAKSLNVIFRTKNKKTLQKRVTKLVYKTSQKFWDGYVMMPIHIKEKALDLRTILDYINVKYDDLG